MTRRRVKTVLVLLQDMPYRTMRLGQGRCAGMALPALRRPSLPAREAGPGLAFQQAGDPLDQQPPNFTVPGVAAGGHLGVQQLAVDAKFEHAALAGNQRPGGNVDFQLALTQDFIRQTDGTIGIASQRAVMELDFESKHEASREWLRH